MGAIDDERVAAGVDHLQAAAREMIAAARSFLDVIEDLVADPDKVADVLAAVGTAARSASRVARDAAGGPPSGDGQRRGSDSDGGGGVQHIRVS
jgi:hypothetical protein